MVELNITNATAITSSSLPNGTPQLTINRDATIDLDSSNAFEGPEKLLEVWFSPSPTTLPNGCDPRGLKAVSQDTWTEVLDIVNCKVLSVLESEHFDAYLLSESSMFVWPHKLILKTCGTTTLLHGLPRILEIAALTVGFPHAPASPTHGTPAVATPHRIFYSRKNFLNPLKQKGPHRSWHDEVAFLDRLFEGGSAYIIGKMNGDHWYLYTTGPGVKSSPAATPMGTPSETRLLSSSVRDAGNIDDDATEDETLEILMTDLAEDNARQFFLEDASLAASSQYLTKARKDAISSLGAIPEQPDNTHASADDFDVFEQTSSDHSAFGSASQSGSDGSPRPDELATEGHALGTVVSDTCGLSHVYPQDKYPDARVDAYLFNPCGFSANGVVPASPTSTRDTHYFTVHVTPEPHCSYASFETNVPHHQSGRETADVVTQVVKIFKPGRFSVTLFEAKRDEASPQTLRKKYGKIDQIEGYRRLDRIVHDLEGYDLVFRYYERLDWKGGAPRIGEFYHN